MAEVKRNMGDMRSAMQLAFQADDLVKKYVTNPEKNPLTGRLSPRLKATTLATLPMKMNRKLMSWRNSTGL